MVLIEALSSNISTAKIKLNMSVMSCRNCNSRISHTNKRNLKCKRCLNYFHPKCIRFLPPLRVKKNGRHRYEIVRNCDWVCDFCTLSELPYTNVTDLQLRESSVFFCNESKKTTLPSADQMNDIFVSNESAGGDDYENTTYFSNKTRYIQS